MHFSVGDLILRLVANYTPNKIIPVDTDSQRSLHKTYSITRDEIVASITGTHWQSIFDAHTANYVRLRKMSGIEYISELSKLIPRETFVLLCRLYTLETILLGYNLVPKLVVEYED